MAYADYRYYTDFKGSLIPELEFDRFFSQARAFLESVAHTEIDYESDCVKNALFEIAEIFYSRDDGLLREDLDGYGVSYSSKSNYTLALSAAKKWLWKTGILYSGVE